MWGNDLCYLCVMLKVPYVKLADCWTLSLERYMELSPQEHWTDNSIIITAQTNEITMLQDLYLSHRAGGIRYILFHDDLMAS